MSSPRRLHWLLAFSLPLMMANDGGGCGGEEEPDDDGEHEEELGPPTEAECPEMSTLTYENFGADFMEEYCLRCHSESVTGAARMGAPSDHNFDTQIEVQGLADHIDRMAGSGPAVTNTIMPENAPAPSMEERQQLSEWLACGAP